MLLKFIYKGYVLIELEVAKNVTLQQISRHIQKNYATSNSSITLSFNGNPLATEADFLAANLTHGSRITLHIQTPPESLLAAGASSTQPPLSVDEMMYAVGDDFTQPPPERGFMTVKYPDPFARTVSITPTVDDTVLQLKAAIQEDTNIPISRIVIKDQLGYELTDAMNLLCPQNRSISELSAEFLPPPPPPEFLRVVVEYRKERAAVKVAAACKVSQLRKMLDAKVNLPNPYIFIHGKVPINENRSFLSLKISDGDTIKIFPGRVAMMIRVVLEYRKEKTAVVVVAAGKVSQLRTTLDKAKNINLPDPYFFTHNHVPIDENSSFLLQSIAEGDVIQIVGRIPVNIRFYQKTDEPNATESYFDVFATPTIQFWS